MKLKLDENVLSAAAVFESAGYDVDTVAVEGLTGAADEAVVDAARDGQRLLVTLDRGLGDIRRVPPGSHAGILVVRLADQSAASVRASLALLVRSHDVGSLTGTVAVLQSGLLRVRRPT